MIYFYYSLAILYLTCLFLLFLYGVNCYVLTSLHRSKRAKTFKSILPLSGSPETGVQRDKLPPVTVQVPIYNEKYVMARLVEALWGIDYPRDRLEIQLLDDSTDETTAIAEQLVCEYVRKGLHIEIIHRKGRDGFKAGALRDALDLAQGEFIAIFDADFIPCRDFLSKTIPLFGEPEVGMVQARWGHLNDQYSLLTRAQSIGIDGHFGVEQASRANSKLFLNFNGTAGVWRKSAILDAGGWLCDTLTEDLDLSYRAQLRGWKLLYAQDVVCLAELPAQINAFKTQQFRWAKGSVQTAKKLCFSILRAKVSGFVKIEALLHLTHYFVHPLMVGSVLLSWPMLKFREFPDNFAFFMTLALLFSGATFGPSFLYLYAQRLFYSDWPKRARYMPLLMMLGTGIAINNTRAVFEGLFGKVGTFVRTPKYAVLRKGDRWRANDYRLEADWMLFTELAMGIYSALALSNFIYSGKYLIAPFLLIYTVGFFYVSSLTLLHSFNLRPLLIDKLDAKGAHR